MAERSEAEKSDLSGAPSIDAGIYIDSSALAKLYAPEAESDRLDTFLRGRRGLMISELAITEVLSAVGRRKRNKELRPELANEIRDALWADAESGSFNRLDLSPTMHRDAERLLLTTDAVPLRTLDALHIALALSGAANYILTFDRRMRDAAVQIGLNVIDLLIGPRDGLLGAARRCPATRRVEPPTHRLTVHWHFSALFDDLYFI